MCTKSIGDGIFEANYVGLGMMVKDRMDYTIIGNEVNLAARLQSHAELGGILITHETCSLIKDMILTEEQEAVSRRASPTRYGLTGSSASMTIWRRTAGSSKRSSTAFGCWSI